jgi:hypothetical protein
VSIDRVNIYPGFGALVRGWALSPAAELNMVSVRQGGFYAEARRDRMVLTARPDLATGFPHLADRAGRAGFSAVCLGPLAIAPGERERPVVAFSFSDGTELEVTATAQNVRTGYSAKALEDLVTDFPALSSEAFFPAFSRSCASSLRRSKPELHYIARASGRSMLLFNMPLPRSDARLALSDIARGCRDWNDVSINLLFGPDHDRSAVMRAVHDVMPDPGVGIIQHDGSAELSGVIARILARSGAETLTLVQAGSRLTQAGWDNAARFHASSSDRLQLYALDDSITRHMSGAVSVGALNWTAAGFSDYARTAVPSIGTGLLGRDLAMHPDAEMLHGMVNRYHASRLSASVGRLSSQMEQSLLEMRNA